MASLFAACLCQRKERMQAAHSTPMVRAACCCCRSCLASAREAHGTSGQTAAKLCALCAFAKHLLACFLLSMSFVQHQPCRYQVILLHLRWRLYDMCWAG